jgi:hypothetical protein
MSNGSDDGYGEVGGNGSVQWVVNVKKLKKTPSHGGGAIGKPHRMELTAENGENVVFKVSVKIPKMMNEAQFRAFLAAAPVAAGKLEFSIPIESNTPDQIRISWGA